MMLDRAKRLLLGSLRRQLIVGMVLVVASLMSMFVWDQTNRRKAEAQAEQTDQAIALARSVATSAAVWVASRDYGGLQEIIDSLRRYPDLEHAIILDGRGQIIAHNDRTRRGLYLSDLPGTAEAKVLQRGYLVDVASPVILGARHLGWVRIGLSGSSLDAKLAGIVRSGFIYTAIGIALSTLVAALAGHYMVRRLYAIREVASAVQTGKSGLRCASASRKRLAIPCSCVSRFRIAASASNLTWCHGSSMPSSKPTIP